MANPRRVETIDIGGETLSSREAYYIPASLDTDPLFCGDDRTKHGLQLFGGVVNIAYNQAVVEEALEPGSVTDTLEGRVEAVTTGLQEHGMHPAVHSDASTEQGTELRHDPAGPVGCAYAEQRSLISQSIAALGEEVVDEAARLRPELFRNPEDRAFAMSVTTAHGRLAERDGFQTAGRKLVLAAAGKGAKTVVLEGEHVADDGLINLIPQTTFDGERAMRDGLPAYNQDAWAAEEAIQRAGLAGKTDANQRVIARLIDTLGTMHALGVETIAIRR